MARIEHAFLTAKESVGFFNESLSRERMELARQQILLYYIIYYIISYMARQQRLLHHII